MKTLLLILILFIPLLTGCSITINSNNHTVNNGIPYVAPITSVDPECVNHNTFFDNIKGGVVFIIDMLL